MEISSSSDSWGFPKCYPVFAVENHSIKIDGQIFPRQYLVALREPELWSDSRDSGERGSWRVRTVHLFSQEWLPSTALLREVLWAASRVCERLWSCTETSEIRTEFHPLILNHNAYSDSTIYATVAFLKNIVYIVTDGWDSEPKTQNKRWSNGLRRGVVRLLCLIIHS